MLTARQTRFRYHTRWGVGRQIGERCSRVHNVVAVFSYSLIHPNALTHSAPFALATVPRSYELLRIVKTVLRKQYRLKGASLEGIHLPEKNRPRNSSFDVTRITKLEHCNKHTNPHVTRAHTHKVSRPTMKSVPVLFGAHITTFPPLSTAIVCMYDHCMHARMHNIKCGFC